MQEFAARIGAIVGEKGLLLGDEVGEKYYQTARTPSNIRPTMVVRPGSTEEVSKVLALCNEVGQPVVAQGGMTGLVLAATPLQGELPISFERMANIEELDPMTGTITAQCGVPLQKIQEYADQHDYLFPLDLGARGSCTVGGNISTNAGGNRVIRYGMMRQLVLGIEAVLADGTIVSSLNKLLKNNSGYDLKQLFIGSEGSLGVITRAVLRLSPKPKNQMVAFCALPSFSAVVDLMNFLQAQLAAGLSAYEVIWQKPYVDMLEIIPSLRGPVTTEAPFFVLLESFGGEGEAGRAQFEDALATAFEREFLVDAVLAKSESEIAALWSLRDGLPEASRLIQPTIGFDVSLPIALMEKFDSELHRRIGARWPNCRIWIFGHLGDSNLHVVVRDEDQKAVREEVDELVYELVGELDGSVSAEHGIGLLKRAHLHQSRNESEIGLMKLLKRTLDPNNILSRGRIFEL